MRAAAGREVVKVAVEGEEVVRAAVAMVAVAMVEAARAAEARAVVEKVAARVEEARRRWCGWWW